MGLRILGLAASRQLVLALDLGPQLGPVLALGVDLGQSVVLWVSDYVLGCSARRSY